MTKWKRTLMGAAWGGGIGTGIGLILLAFSLVVRALDAVSEAYGLGIAVGVLLVVVFAFVGAVVGFTNDSFGRLDNEKGEG
jgi:hypothetical protein